MNLIRKLFGWKPKEKTIKKDDSVEINVEAEFNRTISILKGFKRTAYLPETKENSNSFSSKSKIGGFPYLRHENDWPTCPNCKKNMQLFLQLNLSELPEKSEEGLIQLFYCTNSQPLCESDLEAYFPFSKSVNCRKVVIENESAEIQPDINEIFDEKIIVDWNPVDDYPHFEEYSDLGIDLDLEDEVYEMMEEKKKGLPIIKDKLFGWPYWVQSVEYPFDRNTNRQMELLFQLDSEDHLPYMFGDCGIGYFTQSPDNKGELAFGWACS